MQMISKNIHLDQKSVLFEILQVIFFTCTEKNLGSNFYNLNSDSSRFVTEIKTKIVKYII